MKLLFAPDSFKGSLSAQEVCKILTEAAAECLPGAQCVSLPVADGGEGMVDALLAAAGGERIFCRVQNPLGQPVEACYALLSDGSAAIEMAAASGLPLVPKERRNPEKTSTFGTGELIKDALRRGCKKIVLGLGGSGTNDGGMGAAAALGVRFLDENERELPPCGASMQAVRHIDRSGVLPALRETKLTIACDVENPLCGPKGAAAIYGPQKGADAAMVERLDAGLKNLCTVMERESGISLLNTPGMGAAGGMALPLAAFFGAQLRPGLEIVLDALEFDKHLSGASLVVTGEGRTDEQSAMGKVACGVGKRAEAAGVPAIVLSGALAQGCESLYTMGITAMFSCCSQVRPVEWQMEHAKENLAFSARQLFRLIAAMQG